MSRTRNSVKIQLKLVASKWRHQLYKIQIHSELLAILKKKQDCDNGNKMRATDTLSIEEYSPCINNSESLSEKCDEKLWQPHMHFFFTDIQTKY